MMLITRADSSSSGQLMLSLLLLSLAILSMAKAASTSNDGAILPLLDIVKPESAAALKELIDHSPGHTYIRPGRRDVNLLKVSIIDGNNGFVISHMELTTDANATTFQKVWHGEIAIDSRAKEPPT